MGFQGNTSAIISNLKKIVDRIEKLEEKVFKTSRKDSTTLKQQLLLLHHLGMLQPLNDLTLSREKKAKLLSILLNGSFSNIRDYLSDINKTDSDLQTSTLYTFLVETFEAIGLKNQAEKLDNTLNDIIKREEKEDKDFHKKNNS